MITFERQNKNIGVVVWIDTRTLINCHNLIADILNRTAWGEHAKPLRGVANTLRDTYENQSKMSMIKVLDNTLLIFGVEKTWPELIVAISMLKGFVAKSAVSEQEMSQIQFLEKFLLGIIRASLRDEFEGIMASYRALMKSDFKHISEIFDSRVDYFISLGKEERRNQLAEILMSLTPEWIVDSRSTSASLISENRLSHATFIGFGGATSKSDTDLLSRISL